MEMINWLEEKGALPYYYHQVPYSDNFEAPDFEVLSAEASTQIKADLKGDRRIIEKVEMCHSVWQFHLLESLESTHLITDLRGKERLKLRSKKLTVFLTYPFQRVVRVTLSPICRRWKNDKIEYFYTVGYLGWQIAKVYGELYRNHWQVVGIHDYGLSDLFFEDFYIDSEGKASLFMGC